MKISFFGATGTVTGSRHLLEIEGKKLLIDCGLFQGPKKHRLMNWDTFPFPPAKIDRVLLTHAHIDHTGYLPRFRAGKFSGQIHCTHATRDLCEIMLRDSAHLQEEDAYWANKKGYSKHRPALPLYTVEDAEKALELFQPLHYGEDLFLSNSLRIKFKDAGHILGSSFVDIKTTKGGQRRKIVFSGDLGRPGRPILRDPVQMFEVDYLILESTYGDRLHGEQSPEAEVERVINETAKRRGVLVVPAFAVGRTQELLFTIRQLEEQGKIPSLPVHVDSPMAINVTEIFAKHKANYDLQAKVLELNGISILQPKEIHFSRSRQQSKALNEIDGEAIIISASGMATGGRVLHHLKYRLPRKRDTVLFIGYQAYGTRGRSILEGKDTVKIHGEHVPVRAHIEQLSGFSAHADYNEILAWLLGFNRPPRKTFIVHGEPKACSSLARKIEDKLGWDVVIPKFKEHFDLD
ncbi:MAG: MBL fold metallo-hydrolase [Deltaproteobacteria bacterium]|nr:MBL fold metallo-hydrolase [Deltaproteobacteria bacterium]MBW2070646.1 MBL fold metallo-hydrolase [Deltaproteobacteria bacterium]